MRKLAAAVLGLCLLGGRGAKAEWYDEAKIKADLRLRHEMIDDDSAKETRNRERIRARLGVFPRINPELDAGFQLATDESSVKTGTADPVSRNQTLTGGFAPKGVYWDLAYIDWHPQFAKGLNAIGGKMKSPFLTVQPDFPFDGDITPEGVAAKYHLGDEVELLANGGAFFIEERKEDKDTSLFAGQAALKFKPTGGLDFTVGGSCYAYDNLKGFAVIDWSGDQKSYGNSTDNSVSGTTTNKIYKNDYLVGEAFATAGFKIGVPVTLYGSYVMNSDADDYRDGYIAGIQIGELKDPWSWTLGYNYRELEKDAVPGFMADSDNFGGGTDGKGHKIMAGVQLARNWQANVNYFIDEKAVSKEPIDYKRLQVDLVAKF